MGVAGTTALWHDQFQSVGSSSNFSTLFNFTQEANQAFEGFTAVQTSSNFSSLSISGYQYYLAAPPTTLIQITDSLALYDATSIIQNQLITVSDILSLYDSASYQGPIATTDILSLYDSVTVGIKVIITDAQAIYDSTSASSVVKVSVTDSLALYDSVSNPVGIMLLDVPTLYDSLALNIGFPVKDIFSLTDIPSVRCTVNAALTMPVEIRHQYASAFSSTVNVAHYFPAAVNVVPAMNGTYTYPYTQPAGSTVPVPTANPFDPTVVTNAITSYEGTTAPAANATNLVMLNLGSLAPGCSLISASLNMSLNSGGSFSIQSSGSGYDVGTVLPVFGISSLVTEAGPGKTNRPVYNMTGICSDARDANKSLLLELSTQATAGLAGLAPNTPLQSPTSLQWTSIAAAAQAIGFVAGITVNWHAVDSPLLDVFVETGMNCLDAIKSLAARVGAFATWDGLSTLVIFNPTDGYGGWNGPACDLFTSGGITSTDILDLEGVAILPVTGLSASSVTTITPTQPPMIDPLTSFTEVIPSNGPSKYVPIPGDFLESFIQIIVNDPTITSSSLSSGAGANGVDPASSVIQNPAIPQNALESGSTYGQNNLNEPGIGPPPIALPWVPYYFPVVKDQANKPFLIVQSGDFPVGLQGKTFRMNIGYTRSVAPIIAAYQQNIQDQIARSQAFLAAQQESYRYYCATRYTMAFKFFGSLPIPGNNMTFSVDGISGSGIVESVSVSYSSGGGAPDVQLSIGQYKKLDLINPIATLDYFLANP